MSVIMATPKKLNGRNSIKKNIKVNNAKIV